MVAYYVQLMRDHEQRSLSRGDLYHDWVWASSVVEASAWALLPQGALIFDKQNISEMLSSRDLLPFAVLRKHFALEAAVGEEGMHPCRDRLNLVWEALQLHRQDMVAELAYSASSYLTALIDLTIETLVKDLFAVLLCAEAKSTLTTLVAAPGLNLLLKPLCHQQSFYLLAYGQDQFLHSRV
jgi:hypothetical protein